MDRILRRKRMEKGAEWRRGEKQIFTGWRAK